MGWPPPVLDPAGPYAAGITALAWALAVMALLVTLFVVFTIGVALLGSPAARKWWGGERLIWLGGVAAPAGVLTALLVWSLSLTADLTHASRGDEQVIRVTGEMWWWRVAYLDGEGTEFLHDANEIHIAAGRPVLLELTSSDVIHSFWVPRLGGKADMIPGRTNYLRLIADQPGVYKGQCAEYCGGPHALMGLVVVAHPPGELDALLEARTRPPPRPVSEEARFGAQVFDRSGCGACHTVRGTSARGLAGPDLTWVGARRTLGAGILPNNRGTLAGWVANSQDIKPQNRMPPYAQLSGRELRAISAYLETLE